MGIEDVIDVSLLNGDAALDSVNHGIIECTCDRFHECQHCLEMEKLQGYADDVDYE